MKDYFISNFLDEQIAKALKIPVEDVKKLFLDMMVTDGIVYKEYDIYGRNEGTQIVLHFDYKKSSTGSYNPCPGADLLIEELEEYLDRKSESWAIYKAQTKREKLSQVATSKGRDLESSNLLPKM